MLGLFLCVLSLISHSKTSRELKRLKGHLSDKLEIEAEKMTSMKEDLDKLKKENENLRLKISSSNVKDDSHAMEREMEIFARAEKAMVLNAPGFAQAWEKAKEGALSEIEDEEAGKSLPRRIFKRFFNRGGTSVDADVVETLPSDSTNRKETSESEA